MTIEYQGKRRESGGRPDARKDMQILEEVKDCKTIGISGHENPDGDCAGSCLGLALYLRKMMPGARVDVFLEPLREDLYNNLPGADTVITNFRTDLEVYDAFIVLDSAKDRISGAKELFERAEKTINIDLLQSLAHVFHQGRICDPLQPHDTHIG